jgi:type I restriction enzyme S subunit
MALNKYSLRELLELTTETNTDMRYGPDSVRGMTITKEIIPTKANVSNTDLRKFFVVHPHEFVFNPRTHGKKIGFGYNRTDAAFLISWNNIAFRVKPEMKSTVMDEYLFLHFNREEWDREACFRSWGSSTEVFSWDALCEMELQLPPLPIQKKYVDVYNAMLANQQSYERGLEDLKLVCDAYIEELRRDIPSQKIGPYLRECDEKNTDLSVTLTQGVDVNMQFIPAKREAVDKGSTRIVRNGQFAFNKVVKSNGTKLPIALRDGEDCIISGSYQVFEVADKEHLLPEYLMLWMARSETQRRCGFNAWGSTRDVFPFDELCKLEFPIPDISIQQDIVNIYDAYVMRKGINDRLKERIKNMCPILIKGSLEEAEA